MLVRALAILSSQNAVGLWANRTTIIVTASSLITRPLILGQEIVRVRVRVTEIEIGEEREGREVKEVVRSRKRVMDSVFLGEEQ